MCSVSNKTYYIANVFVIVAMFFLRPLGSQLPVTHLSHELALKVATMLMKSVSVCVHKHHILWILAMLLHLS